MRSLNGDLIKYSCLFYQLISLSLSLSLCTRVSLLNAYERESLSHTEREEGNQLNTGSVYDSLFHTEKEGALSLSLSLLMREREREVTFFETAVFA